MTLVADGSIAPSSASKNTSSKDLLLELTERVIVAALYGHFAFRLWLTYKYSFDSIVGLLLLSETIPVVLVLIRKPSTSLSRRPSDWLFGIAGTTVPLLISPAIIHPVVSQSFCLALVVLGMAVQISAKAVLGLSFGIVAANRGVKVLGPYRFIRHPMYAGYQITTIGLLLAMPSLLNTALYASAFALQVIRIFREERLLSKDQDYRNFSARVRYRLLPGVF
jgi:protein-S-isoprenylcysteine O-methyltransferase Ste14